MACRLAGRVCLNFKRKTESTRPAFAGDIFKTLVGGHSPSNYTFIFRSRPKAYGSHMGRFPNRGGSFRPHLVEFDPSLMLAHENEPKLASTRSRQPTLSPFISTTIRISVTRNTARLPSWRSRCAQFRLLATWTRSTVNPWNLLRMQLKDSSKSRHGDDWDVLGPGLGLVVGHAERKRSNVMRCGRFACAADALSFSATMSRGVNLLEIMAGG